MQLNDTSRVVKNINGKAISHYIYKGVINRPGTYLFGPAQVEIDSDIHTSNRIRLVVGEQQQVDQKSASQKKTERAFLRLFLDKPQAYVGEKRLLTLRFYCKDDAVQLKGIVTPSLEGFTVSKEMGPVAKKQEINGQTYTCAQVQWEIFPTEPGDKTIPAYAAEFTLPVERDDFHSFFSTFWGPQRVAKRTYSNTATLQVDPLPSYDGEVHAVGRFREVKASLDHTVAREGEGMVLRLSIQGEGDLDALEAPLLQLPSTLRFYDSKAYLDETAKQKDTKVFEYIIQAMQSGSFEIPSQKFTYFDVASGDYNQLKTEPISVAITPDGGARPIIKPPTISDDQMEKKSDGLAPLNREGSWYGVGRRQISWRLFFILCLLPFCIWIFLLLIKFISWYRLRSAPARKRKNAFVHARCIIKRSEPVGLYQAFIDLIALRLGVPASDVTEPTVKIYGERIGLNEKEMEEWGHFFTQISELIFFKKEVTQKESEQLYNGCNELDSAF